MRESHLKNPRHKVDLSFLAPHDLRSAQDEIQGLQLQIEKLKRENSEMVSILSHELKEPLRTVSLHLSTAIRYSTATDQQRLQQCLKKSKDCVRRLFRLVDRLSELSSISRREVKRQSCDSKKLIEDVCNDLESLIRESGTSIFFEDLPNPEIHETDLKQILENLITNAIKFQKTIPVIQITGKETLTDWVFSVSDNGIGIKEDAKERIFEIFGRLHPAEAYPGSGIGLAVCRKCVERYGGKIWVESTIGKGSTFYFSIPRPGNSGQ